MPQAALANILKFASEGICLSGSDRTVRFLNSQLLEMLGAPVGGIAEGDGVETLNRYFRVGFERQNGQANGAPKSWPELDFQHPVHREWLGREGRSVEVRGTPLADGGYLVSCIDITNLRLSEERLRDFAESGSDWRFELDDALRILSISDNYRHSPADRLVGRTPWEVAGFPEPIQDPSWVGFKEILLANQPFRDHPVPVVTEDGRRLWRRISGRPLIAQDGRFFGYRCVTRDVTELKLKGDTLELRDRALAAISQGIVIADARAPDLPVIYANSAFETISGYTAADILGRNMRLLQGADTDREMVATIRSRVAAGAAFRGELANYRKDGRVFRNDLSISPVRDDEKNLTHFVGVQNDVTDYRQLESQFAQSQKMELVGQLAGGIAHDFNNLLMVINGNLELLKERRSKTLSDDKALLEAALDAGLRGAELTRRMLAFARRQILEPRIVDANRLISRLRPLLQRALSENISLVLSLAPTLWRSLTDPSQLESAVINLAVNARDAMPSGGQLRIVTANVELGAERHSKMRDLRPGDYVMIAVSDTGTGMDADTCRRAFEPFFTTKQSGEGTGLGLSMVQGFIAQCGGQVTLESKEGAGTTVTLYLPRVHGPDELAQAHADERLLPRGSETLLLVEDDPMVRATVSRMVRELGYRTVEASNANSALQKLGGGTDIDLVFTDVIMPGSMTGWDLAQAVWKRNPGMKVLFTTGYSDNPILQHAALDGRLHVLQKPYRRRDVALKLREVLSGPPEPLPPLDSK